MISNEIRKKKGIKRYGKVNFCRHNIKSIRWNREYSPVVAVTSPAFKNICKSAT